ncbi:MAG: flavin-containing monooxygenase [Pseudohongiellaceae bacterium]
MTNTITQQINNVLQTLNHALAKNNTNKIVNCFLEDGYWRDLLAFTWNIKTLEGHNEINDMLQSQLQHINASAFSITPKEPATEEMGMVTAWLIFETDEVIGYGHIRLVGDKIFSLFTSITELKGHAEALGPNRPFGTTHGADNKRINWKDGIVQERSELGYTTQPYALIIGGGQSGLALGARLKMLGVPAIIIDLNNKPGDNWRKRYKSLCLHDPVWYDHLPYIPFPENWPVFTPKDKLGDWLEFYCEMMELNYWGNTACKNAQYDEASGNWLVTVDRAGEEIILKPTQLVLATGLSGKKTTPKFKGIEKFKGEHHHSADHPGADTYKGKKALVVGSNNSAHDIAAALWENDVDVTMMQRSSTLVVRSEPLMDIALAPLYSQQALENGITTDKADMILATLSVKLIAAAEKETYDKIQEIDADFYDRLRKAGFELDFGEDGTGTYLKALRRGSGYYIDVGASELVADGLIKLKNTTGIKEITKNSVIFEDGSELETDLIIYATGYGNMKGWIEDLISDEVADKVGIIGGLGSDTTYDPGPWEGESRNLWKPTNQPGLWIQAGNFYMARFYSKYTALQIKARMEGISTPVYGIPGAVNPEQSVKR